MGMNYANEFAGLKSEMGLGPNLEQEALVAKNGPADFSATAPAEAKADVGKIAAKNDVSPAHIAGSAMIVGQTLADPGIAPKGDMNYACSTLGNMMKDTVTSLFGALKPEPDPAPERQVAPPPRPQAAFGL